jgi:hypothetical protein
MPESETTSVALAEENSQKHILEDGKNSSSRQSSPLAQNLPAPQANSLAQQIKNSFSSLVQRARNFKCTKYFLLELERTLFALLFFISCTVFMVSCQMLSDWLFQKALDSKTSTIAFHPLRDFGFAILPDLSRIPKLPDYLLEAFMGLMILFNIIMRDKKGNLLKYGSIVLLRRILFIIGFVYLLRGFCFFVTSLPNPNSTCTLQYPRGGVGSYFMLLLRMVSGSVTACTDNIYSGHTSWVIVCLMTFHIYQSRIWIIICAYLMAFTVLFAIISTHLHYTVDVIVAIIVSSSIYLSYHYLVLLALDDIYFNKKLGHSPYSLAGFSWQERNKMMKMLKNVLIRTIRWCDGIDIRTKYAPTFLVHFGHVNVDSEGFYLGQDEASSVAFTATVKDLSQPSSSTAHLFQRENMNESV